MSDVNQNSGDRSLAPAFAAAAMALVLWSGTPISNKIALDYMDSLTVGSARSMIAGLVAVVVALLLKLPFPDGSRDRAILLVSGVCSFAAWPVTMSIGIGRTTVGHAALIMAMIPLFTVLIGALVQRRRPRAGWWFGAGMALTGALFLMMKRGITFATFDDGSSIVGDLVVLGGGVTCSIGYVAGAVLSPKIGTVATTFWGLAMALVIQLPLFAKIAGRTAWSAVPVGGWLALGWLTILSSLTGYALWYFALGRGGIGRIGSLQLALPVATLIAAAIILSEPITVSLAVACVVIIFGTFFAQRHAV
jgi:drug/metabolite transporter (DMT)-like permease